MKSALDQSIGRSVGDFLPSEHFCGAGDDIRRSHGGAIWAGPHPHRQQVNYSTTTCALLIITPNLSIVVVVLIISGVALHAHYRNRLAVEVRIDILSEQSPSSYSSLYHRP